ncbi:hypothetical protein BH10ACT1_BH10ACT1_03290 [soil metagenome]
MPVPQHAPITDAEEIDRFEAFIGRVQPPPSSTTTSTSAAPGSSKHAPGLGRSIVIASTATISVTFTAVTIGFLATGTSLASSIGIGLFAAFWGGGGFGAMIGGVVYTHRLAEPAVYRSIVGTAEDRAPELLPPWPSVTPVRTHR